MFQVEHKVSKSIHNVYDIVYDKTGYAHFLIYENNQWIRVSAKHYIPYNPGYKCAIPKKKISIFPPLGFNCFNNWPCYVVFSQLCLFLGIL